MESRFIFCQDGTNGQTTTVAWSNNYEEKTRISTRAAFCEFSREHKYKSSHSGTDTKEHVSYQYKSIGIANHRDRPNHKEGKFFGVTVSYPRVIFYSRN
jgi:hypothetical protein